MYSIGVDFHKAYSHMTVMDEQGQVVRVGKVSNTVEAVEAFVAPVRDNAQAVLEATRNWTVMYDMLERQLRAVYLAHPLKVRIGSTRRSWPTSCAVTCCRPRTSGHGCNGSVSRFFASECSWWASGRW